MVRVSLRRTLGYIVGVTVCSIFLINMHTRFVVLMSDDIPSEGRSRMTHMPELTETTEDEELTVRLISPTVRITSHRQSNTHFSSIVNNTELWFMPEGKARPTASPVKTGRKLAIFPGESEGDRIANQLMFIPDGYRNDSAGKARLKTILFYNGLGSWPGVRPGRNQFLKQGCPINTCSITTVKTDARTSDAILFKDYMPSHPSHYRPREQVWILYLLECPLHTPNYRQVKAVNWTATYRYDSDIVTPYEKWVYYDNRFQKNLSPKNYAANKTKQVAWFVSNCHARNKRLQYAQELKKYINVDIYGACGTKKCPRSNHKACFKMLTDEYKFYLAFENSNCKDYITEKFFINGLRNDVLPIVMGAPPEDYTKVSPHKSFIHVDQFSSPKELAKYLHFLDKNDEAYNEYFQWKGMGTFINTYFFCRLCSMLHVEDRPQKYYENINDWWRGPGTCISDSWRIHNPQDTNGKIVQ